MCNECRGITDSCPVCGDNEPDFERMLDDELDAADEWYNEQKLNQQTDTQ